MRRRAAPCRRELRTFGDPWSGSPAPAVATLLADAGDPGGFLARSQAAFLFSVWLSERGLAFDRDAYGLDMDEMRALAAACRSGSPDPELVARALELHDRLSDLGGYVSR